MPDDARKLARKQAFLDALHALCVEHRVSLHVTDDAKPYGFQSPILDVDMDSVIVDGEVIDEWQGFTIEGYINP